MDANDADRVPEPNAEPDVRDEDTVLADIDGNGGGTLSIVAEHELSQNVNVCAPTKSNVAAPSVAAMEKSRLSSSRKRRDVTRTRIRPRFGGKRREYNGRCRRTLQSTCDRGRP